MNIKRPFEVRNVTNKKKDFQKNSHRFTHYFVATEVISTASGALVVGGVRDIYIHPSHPGDSFECSMEQNQSVSGSQWQSVVVCGSLW